MASKLTERDISEESNSIMELVREKKNFLLSGGAGSGKTYSLVEVLNCVLLENPSGNVACITYTNAAVEEIESRIDSENLYTSTIHDFLWGNIKHFQKELIETFVELLEDEEQSRFKLPEGHVIEDIATRVESIQYKEYLRLVKGIVSHDEVIILAAKMFEKYEKLCAIVKDKYPHILVDEYQDTDPKVIDILLKYLANANKENVIGFFGDAMQSIYEGSVGNLLEYTSTNPPQVHEVLKKQNRRNPKSVIDLANKLRHDQIVQEPSNDESAPNIDNSGNVKLGEIKFLYSKENELHKARNYLRWDFDDTEQVKELNLTHNLISQKADFPELMRIYDKDKIRDYAKRVKNRLKEEAPEFETDGKTLADVITHVKAPAPTPAQREYIAAHTNYFELAKQQPFREIAQAYIDKEQLLDDKKSHIGDPDKPGSNRDNLIRHLFKIENCVRLYQAKQFNKFITATDFQVKSTEDKAALNDAIRAFVLGDEVTIGEAIELADELGLVLKDDKFEEFRSNKFYLFKQVCDVKYREFRRVYEYLEGILPLSTQHKTKGSEYPNVLVVLDNGRWNQYNFKYLFEKTGNESVKQRTQKLFYVCCTRAKEKLAVFFPNPTQLVLQTAKEWFGEENVINLDG